MVMGPDCGTAIVNGVPLGFANVVRRGPVGVVGASGTGTQEVTVRIHQLRSGVSQALGTGRHDLAASIGGISMLHGLKALDEDPDTKVIVLVSKPPAREVAAAVLGAAEASTKPVVLTGWLAINARSPHAVNSESSLAFRRCFMRISASAAAVPSPGNAELNQSCALSRPCCF